MINLIPKEEKRKIMRSFYYRLMILVLVMLSASFLIALCAIVPSYFLSTIKINLAQSKLNSQAAEPVPLLDQQATATIHDINGELRIVNTAEKNKFDISQKVITEVISRKTPDIEITEIMYQNADNASTPAQISVRGTAISREALLLYSEALKADPLFKAVNLPISNYVKGSNIEFYLNLTPA